MTPLYQLLASLVLEVKEGQKMTFMVNYLDGKLSSSVAFKANSQLSL